MSILRRIVLILFGLLMISMVTIAVLVPQVLTTTADSIDRIASPVRILIVIVADLVVITIIYSLVRVRRMVNKGGLIVRAGGSNMLADVSPTSAREQILKAVRDVPNVVSVDARLDAVNGKADIDMNVIVRGETVNVPNKYKEIDRALRQVVLKQLGLQLAERPRVHIQLAGQDEPIAPIILPPATAPVVQSAPAYVPPPPVVQSAPAAVTPPPAEPPSVTVTPMIPPAADESANAGESAGVITSLLHRWRTEEIEGSPSEPSEDINPFEEELAALDEPPPAAASPLDTAEVTMIMPLPTAPTAEMAEVDETPDADEEIAWTVDADEDKDSTSTPTAGLYDETDGADGARLQADEADPLPPTP